MKKEKTQNKIIIYTDGGSRGNPGPSGIGVVITDEKDYVVKKYSKDIGTRTNNEAEYEAVIFALQKAKQVFGKEKIKDLEIEIRMDSELVCRQLRGEYKILEEKLFPLFIKIWNLRLDLGKIIYKEIPREKNREADKLANQAMDERKKQETMF
ncbi:MAG: ribonuclease HI family protein [Candidatus Pacebacteria bacterium]|nr:ribonuclease HI family protein [Candidatus Paceibacterota bacterium]